MEMKGACYLSCKADLRALALTALATARHVPGAAHVSETLTQEKVINL